MKTVLATGPRLGSRRLPSPFVQAALSGYSDWPMRALARRYGAAYTVAEVMIDRFVVEVRGGRSLAKFHLQESDRPCGAQLMGSDPMAFGVAAKRLVEFGFDVIDINFGCPVRSALGGKRGGYHLSQPAVALEIVERVREVVPAAMPVTLKMRRGIDGSATSEEDFFRIFDGARARGAEAFTVHGRTVEQKYVGPSDWSFLKRVKEHAGETTVIGSGDLFSAEACVAMLQQTGVDAVSIARGAIGNPWIFRQALALWQDGTPPCPPSVLEQRAGLEEHAALARQHDDPERWLSALRKSLFKYARLHPRMEDLRKAFGRCRNEADWNEILTTFYSEEAPGVFPQPDEVQCSSGGEEGCGSGTHETC